MDKPSQITVRIADHLQRRPVPLFGSIDPVASQDSVLLLLTGYIDIFLAEVFEDDHQGAQHHVGRVDANSALFPLPVDLPGWQIVLKPANGTEAIPIDAREFEALSTSPNMAAEVDDLLRQWVSMLSAKLSNDSLQPKSPLLIAPGDGLQPSREPVAIAPRTATTASLVWLEIAPQHGKNPPLWMGLHELPLPHAAWLPLTSPAWIQTSCAIRAHATRDAALNGWILRGLQAIYPALFTGITRSIQQEITNERARLLLKERGDVSRVTESIRQLTGTLTGGVDTVTSHVELGSPLMLAMDEIGASQGITFRAPPELRRGTPLRDAVASIARSSAVRYRRIVLKPEEWNRSEAPFLAYRESDRAPLACIPVRGRKYRIYDPTACTREPMTAETLATLEPFAFFFYRPFPQKVITKKDLALFALKGSWGDVIVAMLVGLLASILGMATPIVTGTIFDSIIPGAQRARLIMTVLVLFAASISSVFFNLAQSFALLRLEGKMEARIQAAVWDRLLGLPVPFFRKYSTGDLASRGLAVSRVRQMLTGSAISSIMSGIFSVTSFFLLFYYSPRLALLACGLTFVSLLAMVTAILLQMRNQREMLELGRKLNGVVLQFLLGMAKLRVSGTENRAFVSWAGLFARQKTMGIGLRRINNAMGVFNAVFPSVSMMAIFYVTISMMGAPGEKVLTTGEFLAFLSAYGQFSGAILSLTSVALSLIAIVPLYESAQPILETLPEADDSKPEASELTGQVELSHINFRYNPDGPLILKDVSVEIQPGEFVAFVGPSGAGKSTLLRLLLGFDVPESGAIYLDGQDLQNIDIPSVRQQMGVVMQNASLFSGDIFSNITCSAPYTMDEATEAARLAGFAKDLAALPMGLHTVIGEGGSGLSGGQRQRLMIARAIVGKPRILLFDEATSALDNQTQAIVSRSLEDLNSTRIVIAHRLSTIVHADRIYVMEAGQIVQSGTYGQLMAEPGLFAELARRQLA